MVPPLPRGDNSSTPAVATNMASNTGTLGHSCSSTVENSATCNASVLENATPITKLRCFMAASRQAVANNWPAAPSSNQPT